MALQPNYSQSDHQPTATATTDDEAAARNPSRKKAKRPLMAPSSDFEFESHRSTIGATVCNLSPSQTARITQQFDRSFIARIVGKDIRPGQLAGRLRRHLRLTEDVQVFELGQGHFVLKFSETDFLALEDLPWSIPNLCIDPSPWTPDFKPSDAIKPSFDVWIRLPELSIEYYDDEVLQKIAEAIGGVLVKIDPITKDRRKCKFARICISVNLSDPLPSMIKLGRIQQEIEYEGLDFLCNNCRRVTDSNHTCLSSSIPSGSSGFDPHRDRPHPRRTLPFKEIGSSSRSKQSLIPSESSPASASGSRFQVLENYPTLDLKLNDCPSLPIGGCEKAGPSTRINFPDDPVKTEAVAKQKGKCEISVSVQPLPNLPKESSTVTIKAPELKHVVPLVKNQFKPAKSSNPTLTANRNNQPQSQPSSPPASIPHIHTSEAILKFHSDAIQFSTRMKEISNTPSKEINVGNCPTVYTIDSKKITSLKIALSEARTGTVTVSNQNQYAIDIVPTLRDGDEGGVGLESVSGSESCSKKILCWKSHGTDIAKLMRALKDLIQRHEPSIVLIFGTKISGADVDQVVQELCGSYCRKPDGFNDGVWLLLSRQDVQIELNSYSPQQVSASVYFHSKTNVQAHSPPNVDAEASRGSWESPFFFTPTKAY